jgi:hypothetical protein
MAASGGSSHVDNPSHHEDARLPSKVDTLSAAARVSDMHFTSPLRWKHTPADKAKSAAQARAETQRQLMGQLPRPRVTDVRTTLRSAWSGFLVNHGRV